jgi:tetratricopeptide (TPR) repeat protein
MTLRPVLEPASVALRRQKMVFEALSLLMPFDLPGERKVRIGAPGDGSYVMVDRLRPSQPVMSFGVGPSLNFDLGMAERGHDILLFDHTIDKLPAAHPRFTWFREGIASVSDPGRALFTLAEHLAKLPAGSEAPILKLDVEGAEWEVLGEAPAGLLGRFEQITLELHQVARLDEPRFNAGVQKALRKLAADFTLCHVHANNFGGVPIVGGFPVPEALEVTYVRSDLVTRAPSTTIYPSALDAPNYQQWPDHLLWYFPFLPGSETFEFPADAIEKALDREAEQELASHDKMLARNRNDIITLNSRGLVLQKLRRLEEALASYDEVLAIKPDAAEALYNRGNVLKDLKRFDEALVSYDQALAIKPDFVIALNNRGWALQELKRYEEALASYDKALVIKPDHATSLRNRESVLRDMKQPPAPASKRKLTLPHPVSKARIDRLRGKSQVGVMPPRPTKPEAATRGETGKFILLCAKCGKRGEIVLQEPATPANGHRPILQSLSKGFKRSPGRDKGEDLAVICSTCGIEVQY